MDDPTDRNGPRLLDLPESLLLTICSFLDPKPDLLYGLARTCQRFRQLVNDPGASHQLVVHPSQASAHHSHLGQNKHTSLEAALSACRPGSTIRIQPGLHLIRPKNGLIIKTSVNIIGDSAEQTVLRSAEGCDAALDIRATCKIMGLAVEAVRGSCVLHRAGHLCMERCRLSCDAKGLDHLCSPLITTATTCVGRPLEGPGRLTIAECSLEGGKVAIQCLGTGSLASVRVIYRARRNTYFLGVDCQVPGVQQQQLLKPHLQQLQHAAADKEQQGAGEASQEPSQVIKAAAEGQQHSTAGIAALARLLQKGPTAGASLAVPDGARVQVMGSADAPPAQLQQWRGQRAVEGRGAEPPSAHLDLKEVPLRSRKRYKF